MKPHFLFFLAATFALPGCISQKKMYDQLTKDIQAVEKITYSDTARIETSFAQDTLCFELPTEQLLYDFPDTGSYFSTETANVFMSSILMKDTVPAVSFRIIQRMKPVVIKIPIPESEKVPSSTEVATAEGASILDIINAVSAGSSEPPEGKKFPSWVLILIAILSLIKKYWNNYGSASK